MKESLYKIRFRSPFIPVLFLAIIIISGVAINGQTVRKPDYKSDQVLKSNARVNPSTRAMELSVPVGGYPGRGGDGLPVVFNYSSKVWQIYAPPESSWQERYGTIITDTKPLYGRRSAAGWTSNLGVPRIDYELGVYEGPSREIEKEHYERARSSDKGR